RRGADRGRDRQWPGAGNGARWRNRRTPRRCPSRMADRLGPGVPGCDHRAHPGVPGGARMSHPVYDAAFFEGQAERSLVSARTVLSRVFPLLRPRRLLDVGCGVGTWLRAALELGAAYVLGTDGTYVDREALLLDRDRFMPADLATEAIPQVLGSR